MTALMPLTEDSRIRLLRNVFRRNRLPVAGFAEVYVADRDYWMNAVALATIARMVSIGKGVHSEVHYLSDVIDQVTGHLPNCLGLESASPVAAAGSDGRRRSRTSLGCLALSASVGQSSLSGPPRR